MSVEPHLQLSASRGCIARVYASSNQQQMHDGIKVQVLEVKKIEARQGQSGDRYR